MSGDELGEKRKPHRLNQWGTLKKDQREKSDRWNL